MSITTICEKGLTEPTPCFKAMATLLLITSVVCATLATLSMLSIHGVDLKSWNVFAAMQESGAMALGIFSLSFACFSGVWLCSLIRAETPKSLDSTETAPPPLSEEIPPYVSTYDLQRELANICNGGLDHFLSMEKQNLAFEWCYRSVHFGPVDLKVVISLNEENGWFQSITFSREKGGEFIHRLGSPFSGAEQLLHVLSGNSGTTYIHDLPPNLDDLEVVYKRTHSELEGDLKRLVEAIKSAAPDQETKEATIEFEAFDTTVQLQVQVGWYKPWVRSAYIAKCCCAQAGSEQSFEFIPYDLAMVMNTPSLLDDFCRLVTGEPNASLVLVEENQA